MELRGTMDKHEPVHTYVYAGQFIDWRRDELVAGYFNDLYWKYHCINPNDIKRTCRS